MIFWLVFKLEISSNRVIISPRIFGFLFSGVFCMVKSLSFNNSSFALTYFLI